MKSHTSSNACDNLQSKGAYFGFYQNLIHSFVHSSIRWGQTWIQSIYFSIFSHAYARIVWCVRVCVAQNVSTAAAWLVATQSALGALLNLYIFINDFIFDVEFFSIKNFTKISTMEWNGLIIASKEYLEHFRNDAHHFSQLSAYFAWMINFRMISTSYHIRVRSMLYSIWFSFKTWTFSASSNYNK